MNKMFKLGLLMDLGGTLVFILLLIWNGMTYGWNVPANEHMSIFVLLPLCVLISIGFGMWIYYGLVKSEGERTPCVDQISCDTCGALEVCECDE